MTIAHELNKSKLKSGIPDIRPGNTVIVHQKIQEGKKERIQKFEGIVIAHKGGGGLASTITVRKLSMGIGVEKIFPLHSPTITKIEVIKKAKVRRSKLYYLRGYKKKLEETAV
ncbi:MAG: 50S ribosomal protein L19 [Patescibacteria group bacterium]